MANGYNTKLVLAAWRSIGLPAAVAEHQFEPGRRWRFDFAWPALRIAVEVQGGIWNGGRHTRGAALKQEWEKLNTAAARGWRILYCEPRAVTTAVFTDLLEEALFTNEKLSHTAPTTT